MRRFIVVLSVIALFAAGALPALSANGPTNYRTHLTGAEEVPAVDTRAQGQAIFKLSPGGETLHFKLIVANIENVTQAHIHLAPVGENGAIVAWLYPAGPPAVLIPGRSQGVLAQGVITADDLEDGLGVETIADLIAEIEAGNAYVNVHTEQNPAGEVRGQIG